MPSMKKIQKNVLRISLVCLVASSCTSFDWEPRPYVGDSQNQQLVNEHGETVRANQPAFDTFTCFDPENIAELKTAIDRVENRRLRSKLQKSFHKAFR